MAEKPPEKRYLRLNVEPQDFVGLALALIGTLILLVEMQPAPTPTFTTLDYVGLAFIGLGFVIFLFGGWKKIQWA